MLSSDDQRDSTDPNPDPEPQAEAQPAETPPAEDPPAETPPAEDPPATSDRVAINPQANPDEGLPEWEPLTPELVEDEAIRGDFMMRWAVILLAFLFGCTQIAETETLVHIKSGQYQAAHGLLPPGVDVFSFTAEGQPWVQMSWLFDLVVAGLYAAGGAVALTLTKALLAAVLCGVVQSIARPGVSTWWGTICAAMMVIACFQQFTALPELVTLIGLALTLLCLHRLSLDEDSAARWMLPVGFLVWANLDAGIYFGLVLLLLYGIGELLGGSGDGTSETVSRPRQLWTLIGCCLGAAMINPFGWHVFLKPLARYQIEYPALREYIKVSTVSRPEARELHNYSMVPDVFWMWIDVHVVFAIALVVLALVSLVLNRSRLRLALVLPLCGFVGMAVVASHELAAVSVVACVVATLNFQSWYQASFRQNYSIATRELLFSRFGRAITVLGVFMLAFLVIAGHMAVSEQRRVGLGFSPSLERSMQGVEEIVTGAFDDRTFNFRLDQGDLLIWAGNKVFVDSRIGLYATGAPPSIMAQHLLTREALRSERSGFRFSGRPDVWKKHFDKYKVNHVVPRLYGKNPDYLTYLDLSVSPDWQITQLGAAGAVFYRTDRTDDTELERHVKEHRADFVKQAFQGNSTDSYVRAAWARPPSFYEHYLNTADKQRSNALQVGRHYLDNMLTSGSEIQKRLAFGHLAIRSINRSLVDDPQSAEAYLFLGLGYYRLGDLEMRIMNVNGRLSGFRFLQAVQALRQSLIIEPDNPAVLSALLDCYTRMEKLDLAMEVLEQLIGLQPLDVDLTEEQIARKNQEQETLDNMRKAVEAVEAEVRKVLQAEKNLVTERLLAIVQSATDQGCSHLTLKLLEEQDYAVLIEKDPRAQLLLARLMLEVGRSEEANAVLVKLEPYLEKFPLPDWYYPAGHAGLANGDYNRATRVWHDELTAREAEADPMFRQGFLATLPFITPSGTNPVAWPMNQILVGTPGLQNWSNQRAEIEFQIAQCQMESGRCRDAQAKLKRLIERNPDSPLRPLVRMYLEVTSAEEVIAEYPDYQWQEANADSLHPSDTPAPDAESKDAASPGAATPGDAAAVPAKSPQ